MLALFYGHWDYWELRADVTFDMVNRLIIVNPNVTSLDIKQDVYSRWKDWMSISDNAKAPQAIRTIGGDATVSGQFAGDLYFMVNNWRIQYDPSITAISGAIFSDDYDTPMIDFDGKPVFQSIVASLVGVVSTTTNVVTGDVSQVPTADENAAAVWDKQIAELLATGSTGEKLQKLLTVAKFLALK